MRMYKMQGFCFPTYHEDLWIAQAPLVSIITQGTDPKHACQMLYEAVHMCLVDDTQNGFEFMDRKPDEEELVKMLRLYTTARNIRIDKDEWVVNEPFVFEWLVSNDETAWNYLAVPRTIWVAD